MAVKKHPQLTDPLEADSLDRLPAPTFVGGYLRGYARVARGFRLDRSSIYTVAMGFEPPLLVPEAKQAPTSETLVRLVTYCHLRCRGDAGVAREAVAARLGECKFDIIGDFFD